VLDYHNIPYRAKEVNPLTKWEIRHYKDQYTKVPIAEMDGTPVFGSDQIIQQLFLSLQQNNNNSSKNNNNNKEERLIVVKEDPWVDFAVHRLAVLLYPNLCRTLADSYRAFDYVHRVPSFGPVQRILIQSVGSLVRAVCEDVVWVVRSFGTMLYYNIMMCVLTFCLVDSRPCTLRHQR
jgi:hypothetical protein